MTGNKVLQKGKEAENTVIRRAAFKEQIASYIIQKKALIAPVGRQRRAITRGRQMS